MSGDTATPDDVQAQRNERSARIRRVTLVGVAVNASLALAQIVIGLFAHAQSLVADAMHTLADLLADGFVLFANKQLAEPADHDHPYGHGRIETVASLGLGALLVAVGIGFLVSSAVRMQHLDEIPKLHPIALYAALVTLAAKEGLFRFIRHAARKLRSSMLEANAWHARSDAASSLVVAMGIGGSLAGYPLLEPLAAVLVGFMIMRMGGRLGLGAVRELIDTGLDVDDLEEMRRALLDTSGVMGVHDLRTRRMGPKVLVDAHVQVDPRITVSEGHRIAESARVRLLRLRDDIQDVLVHVDVEDDLLPPQAVVRIPRRAELVERVVELLGREVPSPLRVQLHYLGGKVEVEVFLPLAWLAQEDRVTVLRTRAQAGLESLGYLRSIHICGADAL